MLEMLPPNDAPYDPYVCLMTNVDLNGQVRDWKFEYVGHCLVLSNNGGATWKVGSVDPTHLVNITSAYVGGVLYLGLNFENKNSTLLMFDLVSGSLTPMVPDQIFHKVSLCFNRAVDFHNPILTVVSKSDNSLLRYKYVGGKLEQFETVKGSFKDVSLGRTGLTPLNQLVTETFNVTNTQKQ